MRRRYISRERINKRLNTNKLYFYFFPVLLIGIFLLLFFYGPTLSENNQSAINLAMLKFRTKPEGSIQNFTSSASPPVDPPPQALDHLQNIQDNEWNIQYRLKYECVKSRKQILYLYHIRKAAGTTFRAILLSLARKWGVEFLETEGITLNVNNIHNRAPH